MGGLTGNSGRMVDGGKGGFFFPDLGPQDHGQHDRVVSWVKKRGEAKMGPEMPKDLDAAGRKKWGELIGSCDVDVDGEILGNYCRQHATLLAIRTEKARQMKARTFETMVKGRDGTKMLNPLLVTENRLIASLNRTIRTLGLAPTREEQDRRKRNPVPGLPPPGMAGPEPPCGWAIEIALLRGLANPTAADLKLEKEWDEWLAARKK
jgi:hypothetical protein